MIQTVPLKLVKIVLRVTKISHIIARPGQS